MKKALLLIFVSMILLLAFTSCDTIKGLLGNDEPGDVPVEDEHVHEWIEATCKTAKTCATCGEKVPGTLPHTLVEATCTEPKTCAVCQQTWGEALGHNLSLSTCTVPSTCRRCGYTDGEAPGHDWAEATCTTPKTCKICKTIEGEILGHNYVAEVIEATCETGGKTTNTCSRCNDSYVENEVEALGHLSDVEIPAVAPTCTENGLTAGVECSRCGTATTKQRPIAATGHTSTSELVPPTCTDIGYTAYHCTVCGENYTGEEVPALGHSYGTASCTEAAACSVCGFDNGGEAIGHDWVDATCTEPKMCKREGCGLTEGEALGHNMSEGSCMAPKTCLNGCGYTEGEKATHVLTYKYSNGIMTYLCELCGSSYKLDDAYVLDGTDFDGMTGVNNTVNGYTTADDKPQYPLITEEGYYQLTKLEDTGKPGQLQVWIPRDNQDRWGFSSGNAAVGFLSFRINAYMDQNFGMQFVDGSSGGGRWSSDWCITNKPFELTPPTANEEGRTIVTATGWDGLVLKQVDVTDSADKFTGWFEVIIGIAMDDETDTMTLYYYVDGQYVGYGVKPITTLTNAINSLYISGNTQAQGSGIMIDDIAFGYTVSGSWIFDEHMHAWTVGNTVAPTCTADGYTVYNCECGAQSRLDLVTAPGHVNDIVVDGLEPTCTESGLSAGVQCSVCKQMTKEQKVLEALGHTEINVPALAPTCTEAGHNSGKICTVCNEYTTDVTVVAPLGHSYVSTGTEATCTLDGFMTHVCSVCDHTYDEVLVAKGHDYGDAKCTDTAVCSVCNLPSDGIIGHNFAPATCTEPAACIRGCGATDGEPLGHSLTAATCTNPATCEVCGHIDGDRLPHTIEHKYVRNVLTYYCAECNASYAIDTGYYLDGSNHDGWIGRGNVLNYTVSTGHLPAVVDGHYELINKTGSKAQMQLWMPNESSEKMGFSSANNALGYLSFKFNASILDNIGISFELVDGISNQGENRWQPGGEIGKAITLMPISGGAMNLTALDGSTIASIPVGTDNFTGWVDVKIAIQMNGEYDQVTFHYIIDGTHVYSMSKELTTITNSINCVYISGYTQAKGSGIMLDDVAFGFTANGEYQFDTCKHSYVEATCSTNRYCSICGYIESGSLGHSGGEATCDTLAVCDYCGVSYGDYKHNMSEATCYSAAVCADCGKVVGTTVPHNITITESSKQIKYSCSMCGAYYLVDTYYYIDGTAADFVYNANGSATLDNSKGHYEIIWDGEKSALNPNTGRDGTQPMLWLPNNQKDTGLQGFSCASNALGVISFRLKTNTDDPYVLAVAKERNNTDEWNGWPTSSINILSIGASNANGVELKGGIGAGTALTTMPVGDDGWTEWFDVDIFIRLHDNNTIDLMYYINDTYINTFSGAMGIDTHEIKCVYINGWIYTPGCGYIFDDFVFGYSTGRDMVPGITPEQPDTPDVPDVPVVDDDTFDYYEISEPDVKSETLRTIVANKIKQCDQANPGSDPSTDYFVEGGTPRYVLAERADGSEVEALYFSRSVPWYNDQKVHFTEFRFAVNDENAGAFVTKITFDYIIKGTVEKNDRYTFKDLEGNEFSADAYVQIKTPTSHPLAGDNYPELSGTDLTLDGKWHTMTIDLGADGVEIIDILLNLYHFQGEMLISNLNIEYRA